MHNSPSALLTAPVITAGGITLFGVSTGLQPELLIAGAVGGWWAMSYQSVLPPLIRIKRIAISSLASAWMAPSLFHAISPDHLSLPPMATLPIALLVGLVAIDALGKGLSGFVSRFLNGYKKTDKGEE